MKKFLVAVLGLVFALGVQADGDWRTTLGKVKDLSGDTGIAGFARKEAPDYITGNFENKKTDGSWADRPAAPDFTKPIGDPAQYANKNGFWVTSDAQAKKLSTDKHPVKKGDWIGGYFDARSAAHARNSTSPPRRPPPRRCRCRPRRRPRCWRPRRCARPARRRC